MRNLGLVLSGGGARASYQAGVLSAIGEVCSKLKIEHPFQIYSGVSAGAINACVLTSHSGNFTEACTHLIDLWKDIKSEEVFVSNPISLTHEGIRWLMELSMGGMKKSTPGKALLDTSPLRKLIQEHCIFPNIEKNLQSGHMDALAVTALDYFNTSSVTFVQGIKDITPWQRVRRRSVHEKITVDHLMASSSIPILFPPIELEHGYFGDGSIRNLSPCAPAIYLGAEKILAIGVRTKRDLCYSQNANANLEAPTAARILSVLLNAVMADSIELDMERIERINADMDKILEEERKKLTVRKVEALWISPSQDLSTLAANRSNDLPKMIRYFMRGLGSLDEAAEITSFLLFEKSYCEKLIELGYNDGLAQKDHIEKFLTD
ncbi:patatin-like phospholipase family protein [Bdellovibrio sp. NC01]|uniref:patatin-like phospholipase family protein n=1 Tax=Bdellovibrio sp. NC01 TaxID=2220073 RepID=UPI0011597E03|nr:patatin-like phospholipase family protein [Bdellovibrio sp. NC01]QDK37802.1 patatin family protein [Bdellovibrio sp. NC01]